MNLLLRVNLAVGVVFATGAVVTGLVCSDLVHSNAQREAFAEAGLMMDAANAMRTYTSSEIVPLLDAQMSHDFLPQSVPSYAAVQNFLKLRESRPQYTYKEATLNPTNPRDRAADWEGDIIQRFRNDPKSEELVGERDTPMGRSLYLARPIHADAECLACHSAPSAAPPSVVARYGANNGFGWQEHEVVGAQLVSVPLAAAEASAAQVLRAFVTSLIAVFIIMMAVLNVILYLMIVRPVRQMARVADAVSLGDLTVPEFAASGSSEISALGRSFNRMRTSLEKALKMLEG